MKLRATLFVIAAALSLGIGLHLSATPAHALPVPLCNPDDATCTLGGGHPK